MKTTIIAGAAAVAVAAVLAIGAPPSHDAAPATAAPPHPYAYEPPAPGTYRLPPIRAAADGRVLDHNGRPQRLRDLLDGRITVLAFVYTRCADVCPLAMTLLHELHAAASADPALRQALQLATLSFDPAHDTPEVMAEHAAMVAGAAAVDWRFLTTGGPTDLQPILDGYGQPLAARPSGEGADGDRFAHQLRVFLVDAQGMVRNIYSVGFLDHRLVLADARTLLAAPAGAAAMR